MQNLKKSKHEPTRKKTSLKGQALNFVLSSIGCNALITLHESGILHHLLHNKHNSREKINKYAKSTIIRSAFITLERCQIIQKERDRLKITEFGRALCEYIGLIRMLFDGYGDLIAKQKEIVRGQIPRPSKLIRGTSISQAAVYLSKNTIDPILLKEFSNLKFSGTICDLGCGYARMLSKMCHKTGNPGLGFDSEPKVVAQAKKIYNGSNIEIEMGDISKLKGIWEDVVILMQCHVFHDFTPSKYCIKILNSYLQNFPNLKFFFYVDTVSPSGKHDELLPGFDYIHGLLNISPRTYEETLRMFDDSQYKVVKEVTIHQLPNTFLWILIPKKRHVE